MDRPLPSRTPARPRRRGERRAPLERWPELTGAASGRWGRAARGGGRRRRHARRIAALGLRRARSSPVALRLAPALRLDARGPVPRALRQARRLAARGVGRSPCARGPAGPSARPSFAELYLSQGLLSPNPLLVPETSWSADAGLTVDGRLGLASATVFTQQYQDPHRLRGRLVPALQALQRRQGGGERPRARSGLGAARAGRACALRRLHATSPPRRCAANEALLGKAAAAPGPPPDLRAARRRRRPLRGARRGALRSRRQFQDLANSPALRVPPALTFGAGGSFRFARHPDARLALEVRNLLDDRTLAGRLR